jgi:hypothetical protein
MEEDLKESDNRSSEIFYSCPCFYGLRKATKGQRRSGVTVEVRNRPLYRMYKVTAIYTEIFCYHLCLFTAVQSRNL